jgi:hypothetical protein
MPIEKSEISAVQILIPD